VTEVIPGHLEVCETAGEIAGYSKHHVVGPAGCNNAVVSGAAEKIQGILSHNSCCTGFKFIPVGFRNKIMQDMVGTSCVNEKDLVEAVCRGNPGFEFTFRLSKASGSTF
jgi:hypothetical protein